MPDRIPDQYAEAMLTHGYGTALYHPTSLNVVKPGACGYLDDLGKWQPIVNHIEDAASLKANNLTPPSVALTRAPSANHVWGSKKSATVSCTKTDIKAGASGAAAGVPVGASVTLDFETSSDFGAVMHCPQDVTEEGYYYHDPFLQWGKQNAKAICKVRPEVKEQGFWIVTKIYATPDVWINAWLGKQKRVTIGFKIDFQPVGEIGPSGEFLRASLADGFTQTTAPPNDKLVVFFSGVHLKYRYLPFGMVSVKEIRGDEPAVVVADPEDETDLYLVEDEFVGRDYDPMGSD